METATVAGQARSRLDWAPMTTSELLAATDAPRTELFGAVRELADAGRIEITADGRWGPRRP